MNDWNGDANSIFKMLGSSNHTESEREQNDFYATDPNAIDILINEGGVDLCNVWECCCGQGHLSERLKEYGVKVKSTDLIDRGYGESGVDFLQCNERIDCDILTNPPYKYAQQFIEHAMEINTTGNRVFMFLKVLFLEGKSRRELFKKYPPKCVYVSSSRIMCAKSADFERMKRDGGSAVAYAWFEFEKGYHGQTIIKWIN